VVIQDFNFSWTLCRPNKAHSELIVDPDRVLSLAIARQRLKMIAGRRPQVAEFACGIEVAELSPRYLDQISREAFGIFPIEDRFGGLIPKAFDHDQYVSFNDTGYKVSRNGLLA